ncbi:hypothetical protein ACM6U9_003365 [Vibrio parahaemolyticus]|nr:hypothetical protein [Vibrio parahaemolyticus]
MKQVFIEGNDVIAVMDSQEARARGDIIEDLPVGYKIRISDIKYQSNALVIECRRYSKAGFPITRLS